PKWDNLCPAQPKNLLTLPCEGWSLRSGAPKKHGRRPNSAKSHREACGEKGCARALGEPCGVYTPSCARGLRCIPRAGERTPLHALLHGKGVCRAVGESQGEPPHAGASGPPAPWSPDRGKHPVSPVPPEFSICPVSWQAPCRMHLAAVMLELKAPLYLSGEDIFIPNCDTKGFYRKKQCRASKGQRRGQCWCVDKKGHPLAGSGGAEGASPARSSGGPKGWM
uniref:Insulin like growth factor binding protein 6 n=1 Tax=Chelonoidis abingdonii TaxID=106734 RepID=A0A8C0GDB2_CHEAB